MKRTNLKALSLILATLFLLMPVSVFAEEGVTYDFGADLALGTAEYESSSLAYTVYGFWPDEIGEYTISSDNLLGSASYNGYWVTTEPDETTVTENSVVWECTAVGQGTLIAVKTENAPVTITVERQDIVIITYETIVYENTHTPTEFTLEGEKSDLIYVDISDETVDTAVPGEDGFLHLNSETGPLLYANLSHSSVSLAGALEFGQLKIAVKDENGNMSHYIDYCNACTEYVECADSSLYPLTEDLALIFKNVGNYKGWYGEESWTGGLYEDAWMFACCYFPAAAAPETYTVTVDGVEFGQFEAGATVDLPALTGTTVGGYFARFFTYTGADVVRSAYNSSNAVNGRTYSMVMPANDVELTSEFTIIGNLYNNDSKINARDTNLMKKLVNDPTTSLTEAQLEAADILLDGKYNARDTLNLKKMVGNLFTPAS